MERSLQKYDYLVVGAGLFGATFAYEAAKRGQRVKVIVLWCYVKRFRVVFFVLVQI